MGLRQTKHIPPALPVSGTLSSSNPDLLQSHHRILDFNTTPGKDPFLLLFLTLFPLIDPFFQSLKKFLLTVCMLSPTD